MKRLEGNAFMSSFAFELPAKREDQEANFLEAHILLPVRRAGLLPPLGVEPREGGEGNTDLNISDADRVRMVVEDKGTHSLPLPMQLTKVFERFSNGRVDSVLSDDAIQAEQERDRLCVTDTIGQLLRYLLLNGCRYGALSSGTRTYFVCMLDDSNGNVAENVYSSRGHGSLVITTTFRAWAFVYSLTATDNAFFERKFREIPQILASWADRF